MAYVGEFGVEYTIHTHLDLTGTTSILLRFKPPDPHTPIDHILDTSAITDPAVGDIVYILQVDDFPVKGDYQIQVSDQTPGRLVRTSIGRFEVYQPL